jgi:hypothetical protein
MPDMDCEEGPAMSDKSPDPTKDPRFQSILRTFVTTPPKPHKPVKGKKKTASRRKTRS